MVDISGENCISSGLVAAATNIRYRCIKMKAKSPPREVWDDKANAPPNKKSSWKKYSIHYIHALNAFDANLTAYDVAILKGRANPQLAVFLLLNTFLKDRSRVFLCCTRPYLRNVHYSSVKEYFVNDALLWDSKYGFTVLRPKAALNGETSSPTLQAERIVYSVPEKNMAWNDFRCRKNVIFSK